MKRILAVTLCIIVIASLSACGVNRSDNGKLSIVTTVFPEYDWVRQICGEDTKNADITMLLNNGIDFHSYQPTADDIIKISTSDMFIYVGGESDEWVEDVLAQAKNKDIVVINLLEVLGKDVKEEEIKEGMQAEEEEDSEEVEYDEHIWLSLKNAVKICRYIADKLGEIDTDNKDAYTANAEAYIEKLNALDGEYERAVSSANTKTLLFGDRFPFRYLTDDYGLNYYAAFAGCSAESEASFETVVFLANKVDELGLKAILQIESTNGKIAETVKNQSKDKNQKILTLNSLQSVTLKDVAGGVTYLSVMEENLQILKEALK